MPLTTKTIRFHSLPSLDMTQCLLVEMVADFITTCHVCPKPLLDQRTQFDRISGFFQFVMETIVVHQNCATDRGDSGNKRNRGENTMHKGVKMQQNTLHIERTP